MDAIALMIDEHKYIKRMLNVIRKYSLRILDGKEVDYQDVFLIIDFARKYADNHHHCKEEDILFKYMVYELGSTAEKLVRHGMLVEHDLGRLYMRELEEATQKVLQGGHEAKLDVIGHAMSYYHLLQRHISKEDQTVYQFGKQKLSAEAIAKVNKETEDIETEATHNNTQTKYIDMLSSLERKYVD